MKQKPLVILINNFEEVIEILESSLLAAIKPESIVFVDTIEKANEIIESGDLFDDLECDSISEVTNG